MTDSPELTLALPVKNGGKWLTHTLDEIDGFLRGYHRSCEVIVVDDGSTDGTSETLRTLAEQRDYLRVLTHPVNRGKGAALVTAILAAEGRYVFTMDSDATYSAQDLPRFLAPLEEGYDAVFGNRRDARTRFILHPVHFPYIGFRHALGWLFALAVRLVIGGRVSDPQCGFKAYRGEVIRRIAPLIRQERFAFDAEVLSWLGLFERRIAEVPVLYVYRQQHSSVRLFRDGLRMATALFRIRAQAWRRRRTGVFADADRPDYQFLAIHSANPIRAFWHGGKWPLVRTLLGLGERDRLLDVGSGSSNIPLEAGCLCAVACALDRRVESMAFMRRYAAANGYQDVHYIGGDIHGLPFPDGSFDKVVALEIIEHLDPEGIQRYVRELRRVLVAGGLVLITTPNYRSHWLVLEYLIDRLGGAAEMGGAQHISRFHAGSLRRALEGEGLEIVREGSVYHASPFLSAVLPGVAQRVLQREMRSGKRLGPILYVVARNPVAHLNQSRGTPEPPADPGRSTPT